MTIDDIKKVKQQRKSKIKGCLGVNDGYRWFCKNYDIKISRRQYGIIIKELNKDFIENFLNSGNSKFPYGLGEIQMRKERCHVSIENGTINTNLMIDWGETLKLWTEDEEARKNKILLRREQKYNYHIFYSKKHLGNFKNRIYYKMRIVRTVYKRMIEKLNNNELEAFLI